MIASPTPAAPERRHPPLDLDRLLGDAAPDRLAVLVLAYLTLPGLVFLGGWAQPWAAAVAGLSGLGAVLLAPGWRRAWPLSPGMTLACLVLGLVWAGATGSHHLVYSSADWQIRDAVLRDLTAEAWPVAYLDADRGVDWLLRAPLGFYMVPGLLGRVLGFPAAQAALWAWTGLGFALVLMVLALLARAVARDRPGSGFAVMAGVFILFHGLDILPNIWLDWNFGTGPLASWGRGGEWWPRLFQYSGHVTAILWAPNHAMPAWLLALLVLRHGRHPEFVRGLAMPFAAGAFWSPLASAGAALLAGAVLLREGGAAAIRRAVTPANILAVVFALPVCAYLVAGSAAVPHGVLFLMHPPLKSFLVWLVFLVVEVLCWAALAALLVRGWTFAVSVALLCLLPLYVFGPGNEMTARGGMAPLAVLAVVVAAALLAPAAGRAGRIARRALLACCVLALAGAATEASLLLKPAWKASGHCDFLEAARQSVYADSTEWAHYLAPWPEPLVSPWMREPPRRPADRTAQAPPCWTGGGP
ncbi:hypothetical protein [Roseomonas indoligenes]|uniref:Uncharacterized protein n=1 Tax=Roseomonas indoligenes TaxID=2820811 RepID=A0A940MZF2_9PROT|nr:hypothetical protein [Pararoseomonas indoligenes]MBP0491512.1 hypothetical protein [Pararoseomonas indoligenes]